MVMPLPRIRKRMVFVLLALFLGQFGSGVYDLVFSNFLRDAQHLDVEMRGFIELPRSCPASFPVCGRHAFHVQ